MNIIVAGMLIGRGRLGERKRQNCAIRTGNRIQVVICMPLYGFWSPFVLMFFTYAASNLNYGLAQRYWIQWQMMRGMLTRITDVPTFFQDESFSAHFFAIAETWSLNARRFWIFGCLLFCCEVSVVGGEPGVTVNLDWYRCVRVSCYLDRSQVRSKK